MISQEQFEKLELEHGCGYWNVCWEHACPCAITVENKGYSEEIYDSLKKEAEEVVLQAEKEGLFDEDIDYDPMVKCSECGCWERKSDLIDGLCFDCYEDEEEDPFKDDDLGCFDCNEDCENYDSCMEPNS
jgi:hypothetical protein